MDRVTASVVLYKTRPAYVQRLLECLRQSALRPHLYVVDHSPSPSVIPPEPWITYIHAPQNHGYGAGHNIALRQVLDSAAFHFILNPDIAFGPETLQTMADYMAAHPRVGDLMPRILSPSGSLQYLCKLLPTPLDLFLRRFPPGPLQSLAQKRMDQFELRFSNYDREMDVPFLSGCFMLLRVESLRRVGLFDERFFLYAEDIDLTRRIHAQYRTVFFPGASVIHGHARSSYKSTRALFLHTASVVKYFNKWGWFRDRERFEVNAETIHRLRRDGLPKAG